MPTLHPQIREKYKLLWQEASTRIVIFTFPDTLSGYMEANKLFNALKDYRKSIAKKKLNLLYTKEYLMLSNCRIVRINRLNFFLAPALLLIVSFLLLPHFLCISFQF